MIKEAERARPPGARVPKSRAAQRSRPRAVACSLRPAGRGPRGLWAKAVAGGLVLQLCLPLRGTAGSMFYVV